jgi:hypothetical protein
MNRLVAVFALSALFAASATAARADAPDLTAALQSRYAALKVAIDGRDDKSAAALLATDFVSVDVTGETEDRTQFLAKLDAFAQDPLKSSTTTIVSVKAAGQSATVDQRYDLKTVKTGADGSKRNVEVVTQSTDTWTDVAGAWLLQRTETKQLDYYVNGEQVIHKVATQP